MPQVVYLTPNDGTEGDKIKVTPEVAKMSVLMSDMLADDDDAEAEIPLLEVDKATLKKVVQFLEYHVHDPMQEIQKPIKSTIMEEIACEWDAKFMDVPQEELFTIILAANYLDIPSLLDLGIAKMATMVKDKEPEEVKRLFNIEPDITPEEEKLVREQNPWIFET
jgi:S-phase kinase-associated protein 1